MVVNVRIFLLDRDDLNFIKLLVGYLRWVVLIVVLVLVWENIEVLIKLNQLLHLSGIIREKVIMVGSLVPIKIGRYIYCV